MINPSIVAIYYESEIPRDGDQPALTCEDFANLDDKMNLLNDVKEFHLDPACGVAEAEETVTLKVFLLLAESVRFFLFLNALLDYPYTEYSEK